MSELIRQLMRSCKSNGFQDWLLMDDTVSLCMTGEGMTSKVSIIKFFCTNKTDTSDGLLATALSLSLVRASNPQTYPGRIRRV